MIFLCARWTVQDGVPAGRSSLLVVFRQVAWPWKLGLLLPTWTGDIVRFLESNQFLDSWSNDANAGTRCGVYSAWSGLYWQVWKGRWSDLLVVPQVPQVIIRIHLFSPFQTLFYGFTVGATGHHFDFDDKYGWDGDKVMIIKWAWCKLGRQANGKDKLLTKRGSKSCVCSLCNSFLRSNIESSTNTMLIIRKYLAGSSGRPMSKVTKPSSWRF